MSLTQKYKQRQQQTRVITNESGFSKGMFYTDVPLTEGYAKLLVNFDIDTATGKLTPRKGLQTHSIIYPAHDSYSNIFNSVPAELAGHVISAQDIIRTKTQQTLKETALLFYAKEANDASTAYLDIMYFPTDTLNILGQSDLAQFRISNYATPFVAKTVLNAEVHGKKVYNTVYLNKPSCAYAFNAYYMFLTHNAQNKLCYIKHAADVDTISEKVLSVPFNPNNYVLCALEPEQVTPTEAASWGYNMLLEDPYTFKCEETAINLVTITGIIPYDKNGEVVLTPARGEEITLKGYYRAPKVYHSDLQNGRFYSTKRATFDGDGVSVPLTYTELLATIVDGKASERFGYGTWCQVTDADASDAVAAGYYMIMPDSALDKAKLARFGDTKPGASVKLNILPEGEENQIRVRWQVKSGGASQWTDLSNEVFTLTEYYSTHGDHAPFAVTCTLPADEVIVKLTISDPADTVSTEEYILSTNTIGISAITEEASTALNVEPKKYDLSQCTGMCEWEQRLVLWGVPDALNTIFVSDVNNPGYFPYPNNIDVLPDPVLAVYNFGNELLALTSTSLYLLTWNTETIGWTHKLIQRNLNIREADIPLCCVYKNMFFFKSGEYYYMLVPKSNSSVAGETTIAPVSRSIEGLLDNFHDTIYDLCKILTTDPDSLIDFREYLLKYYTAIEGSNIVVNYVYSLTPIAAYSYAKNMLYVQLVYNTDTRTWLLRIFQTSELLVPYNISNLMQTQYLSIIYGMPANGLETIRALQLCALKDVQDIYYNGFRITPNSDLISITHFAPIIKNCQYLDTGNREINTELKKRFREIQFKLNVKDLTDKQVSTAFYIDGSPTIDIYNYVTKVVQTDTENVIIVEQNPLQTSGTLSPTKLGSWILNQSAFPGRTFWKVRMPVVGKGYTPRMLFLTKNEEDFEFLGYSWVYRTMNAR